MIDRFLEEGVDRSHGDEADGDDDPLVEPEPAGELRGEPAAEDHGQQCGHADDSAVDVVGAAECSVRGDERDVADHEGATSPTTSPSRQCRQEIVWPVYRLAGATGAGRVLVLAGVWRRFGDRVSLAIAWSIRICRQPAAIVFPRARPLRCARMATLLQASPPPARLRRPPAPNRVVAWLSNPRRALLAAVLILTGAVGLDALSDPDVWWHIRLGDWIIAHHQIPAGELFAYTAFGNPLVAHEWLSETIFAALAAVGGLFLVTVLMGLVAWSAMLATLLRGHLRGAGPVVLAIGLALGARAAEPVLGTRPQVFTFALVCWTLWIAESSCGPGAGVCGCCRPSSCSGRICTRGSSRGSAFSLWSWWSRRSSAAGRSGRLLPAAHHRLAVALVVSVLAACVNPYGPWLFVFAATTGATERAKGIIEWQSPNFADPTDVGAPGAAAHLRRAHDHRARASDRCGAISTCATLRSPLLEQGSR